jgi:hypothetical protein
MREPRRLKELSAALPPALSQGLEGAPAGPTELEQRMLLQNLCSTLGVALAPPSVAVSSASNASSAANVSAGLGTQASTVVGLATKSGVSILIWFGGGLAVGTVLSAAALLSPGRPLPQPSASSRPEPKAWSAARSAPAQAPTASASAAFPEPELDAGVRGPRPAPGSALRSPTREKPLEKPETEGAGEFPLLRSAQQTLSTDPLRSLDQCAAHAMQFPSGVMAQEREMIAIEALLRLGRIQQANARASTFLRQFPGSAHATRLENLLQREKF